MMALDNLPLFSSPKCYYDISEEGKGGDNEHTVAAAGLGLHFVKLRPEPITADNMRSLMQVARR